MDVYVQMEKDGNTKKYFTKKNGIQNLMFQLGSSFPRA